MTTTKTVTLESLNLKENIKNLIQQYIHQLEACLSKDKIPAKILLETITKTHYTSYENPDVAAAVHIFKTLCYGKAFKIPENIILNFEEKQETIKNSTKIKIHCYIRFINKNDLNTFQEAEDSYTYLLTTKEKLEELGELYTNFYHDPFLKEGQFFIFIHDKHSDDNNANFNLYTNHWYKLEQATSIDILTKQYMELL